MPYQIKTKNGMAFNLDDPFQKSLYEHICKVPNVSGYLKRLVSMDMQGSWTTTPTVPDYSLEEGIIDSDAMLNLI